MSGGPRLLDLFCKAGGAAVGYHMAGFTVVGIDQHWQPNYPFFMRRETLYPEDEHSFICWLRENFDAVHASPPCQAHTDLARQSKREYPCLIEATRRILRASGLPYVIENVEGAPLIDPIKLCGTMFPELRVLRHRLFEVNWPLSAPEKCKPHPLVFTHDKRKAHYGKLDEMRAFVQVTGGGNCSVKAAADAMRIDWMTKGELNEAIPPAYTRFIGRQLREHIERSQRLAA
jgi:DNA (cytosine-5)-methyltransferase 1